MLGKVYEAHQDQRDGKLRGLLIVSDGANNGSQPAAREVEKFKDLGCPVYGFAAGQPTTAGDQKDVAFTAVSIDPPSVYIKKDVTVKGTINAKGFEGAKVRVRLKIEGADVAIQDVELLRSEGNEVAIKTKAPEKPGEYKVTLEIVDPPLNDAVASNNVIETYMTVVGEGIRVLFVGPLNWEMKAVRNALASDDRIDYVEAVRQTSERLPADQAAKYDLAAGGYNVIVVGDVPAAALTAIDDKMLDKIAELVRDKGVGLMMTGGRYSLGGTPGVVGSGDWRNTPVAQLLGLDLELTDQVEAPTTMQPTREGLEHYLLRLDPDAGKNKEAWRKLNSDATRLNGFTRLVPKDAKPKDVAILARANDAESGEPLMTARDAGGARTLAFGADSTWLWTRPDPDAADPRETEKLHAKFWKQVILWLARKEKDDGNAYVRPEYRRLAVDFEQPIEMGLRDKRRELIAKADLRYQVVGPGEKPNKALAKRPDRDAKGRGRTTYRAAKPGEYRVYVWGEGADPAGDAVAGEADARFIVFPEATDELLNPAARHDFLLGLENGANGTSLDVVRHADRLPSFLEELKANPLKAAATRPRLYPDWSRDGSSWFLPGVLVAFAALLGLEWGLRRAWGMV